MALRIASIIVPKRDNDGTDLEPLHHKLHDWLNSTFGGWTGRYVAGQWVHEGKVYRDASVQYDVYYHEHSEQFTWLRDIAQEVMKNSQQLAIAVIRNGCPAVVPKDKPKAISPHQQREKERLLSWADANEAAALKYRAEANAITPA